MHFAGDHNRDELKAAFESLDQGKSYVMAGSDWLKKEPFILLIPSASNFVTNFVTIVPKSAYL